LAAQKCKRPHEPEKEEKKDGVTMLSAEGRVWRPLWWGTTKEEKKKDGGHSTERKKYRKRGGGGRREISLCHLPKAS